MPRIILLIDVDNAIGDEGLSIFLSGLKEAPLHIDKFYLRNIGLTMEGMKFVRDSLLRHLISFDEIGLSSM